MKEQVYEYRKNRKKNLALIGFMASGKTTVAHELGQKLGWSTVDIDTVIEQTAGCTIAELFAARGERAFRDLENESVEKIANLSGTVIACGGGVVLDENNRAIIKNNCHVIWLWANSESIAARVGNDNGRPLLWGSNEEDIDRKLKERLPSYALTSDIIMRTDNKTATEIAERIGYENHFTFSH